MNYFQFYDLPVKFNLDVAQLRQKFFELSKKFHPDFYIHASKDVRDTMLLESTRNNDAYKTLNNATRRLRYVLEVSGVLSDEEKEILPQAFLMEMMELNEAILEANEANYEEIKEQFKKIEDSLNDRLSLDCIDFDETGRHDILLRIKTNYLKQKYLLRIKESMLKFASL